MQQYRIVVNGNTYTVTVKSIMADKAIVDVDGWEFEVGISEAGNPADIKPAAIAGAAGVASAKEAGKKRSSAVDAVATKKVTGPRVGGKGLIAAHLPGLILEVLVKPGDTVKVGDLVIKMEAMKMVNEIHARTAGVVKEIFVDVQQNVLENHPLLLIE